MLIVIVILRGNFLWDFWNLGEVYKDLFGYSFDFCICLKLFSKLFWEISAFLSYTKPLSFFFFLFLCWLSMCLLPFHSFIQQIFLSVYYVLASFLMYTGDITLINIHGAFTDTYDAKWYWINKLVSRCGGGEELLYFW